MINNKACAKHVEEKFSRKIENLVMLFNKYYQNKGKIVYVTNTSNHILVNTAFSKVDKMIVMVK